MSQDNSLQLGDVRNFFAAKHIRHISAPEAVAYVATRLIEQDVYGTQLIQDIQDIGGGEIGLSDTVLYRALNFFKAQGLVETYQQKVNKVDGDEESTGRGRPRVMYKANLTGQNGVILKELASYWKHGKPLAKAS